MEEMKERMINEVKRAGLKEGLTSFRPTHAKLNFFEEERAMLGNICGCCRVRFRQIPHSSEKSCLAFTFMRFVQKRCMRWHYTKGGGGGGGRGRASWPFRSPESCMMHSWLRAGNLYLLGTVGGFHQWRLQEKKFGILNPPLLLVRILNTVLSLHLHRYIHLWANPFPLRVDIINGSPLIWQHNRMKRVKLRPLTASAWK